MAKRPEQAGTFATFIEGHPPTGTGKANEPVGPREVQDFWPLAWAQLPQLISEWREGPG